MGRPAPTIIMSRIDPVTWIRTDIMVAETTWQVVFDGMPFALRSEDTVRNNGRKYHRTTFPHPTHAHRMAEKLNKRFKTDRFTVRELA